jgi:hypothetical protein
MRYKPKDTNERIQDAVNAQNRVEFEPTDMTPFNFPTFREADQSKWKTKLGISLKDWNAKNKAFNNPVENMNSPGSEPYVEGIEALGLSMI